MRAWRARCPWSSHSSQRAVSNSGAGYGAHSKWYTTIGGMANYPLPGIPITNIDNLFGAFVLAASIMQVDYKLGANDEACTDSKLVDTEGGSQAPAEDEEAERLSPTGVYRCPVFASTRHTEVLFWINLKAYEDSAERKRLASESLSRPERMAGTVLDQPFFIVRGVAAVLAVPPATVIVDT